MPTLKAVFCHSTEARACACLASHFLKHSTWMGGTASRHDGNDATTRQKPSAWIQHMNRMSFISLAWVPERTFKLGMWLLPFSEGNAESFSYLASASSKNVLKTESAVSSFYNSQPHCIAEWSAITSERRCNPQGLARTTCETGA